MVASARRKTRFSSAWRLARRVVRAALPIVILLLLVNVASACPTCKESLAGNDPAGSGVARGYYWSILFMMAMPFTLFSLLGAYFYWEIRKARRRSTAMDAG